MKRKVKEIINFAIILAVSKLRVCDKKYCIFARDFTIRKPTIYGISLLIVF